MICCVQNNIIGVSHLLHFNFMSKLTFLPLLSSSVLLPKVVKGILSSSARAEGYSKHCCLISTKAAAFRSVSSHSVTNKIKDCGPKRQKGNPFKFTMADATSTRKCQEQKFDYLLILDFEATCDDKKKLHPQEIIEFPVLKLNVATQQVDSTFHQYVQPQYHPVLTPFCTELTGIIQDMVDGQPDLPEVLKRFHEWMQAEGLLDPFVKSAFVTCGDWDLKTMLPKQCSVLGLTPRPYFRNWINIKKSYADVTSTFPKGMMNMLTDLKLKHVGRHHSGIDDCRNIANIATELIKKGYVFKENGHS